MRTEGIVGTFCGLGRESRLWPERQVLMGSSGHWQARWGGAGFLDHRDKLNLLPPYLEDREKRKEKQTTPVW